MVIVVTDSRWSHWCLQGGDCLERAHKIRVVVFDKTGTLTLGRPAVTGHALFAAGRLPLDEVLQLACALEANSEHPLAQAVLTFTANRYQPRIWTLPSSSLWPLIATSPGIRLVILNAVKPPHDSLIIPKAGRKF